MDVAQRSAATATQLPSVCARTGEKPVLPDGSLSGEASPRAANVLPTETAAARPPNSVSCLLDSMFFPCYTYPVPKRYFIHTMAAR